MMPRELTGVVEFVGEDRVPVTFYITDDIEDGCRIYEATLSIPKLVTRLRVDMLPARSAVRLVFAPPEES